MFTLNTKSGYVHSEDHGEGANSVGFDRLDEADLEANRLGLTVTFCKTCFPGNRNSMDEEAFADASGNDINNADEGLTFMREDSDEDNDDEA